MIPPSRVDYKAAGSALAGGVTSLQFTTASLQPGDVLVVFSQAHPANAALDAPTVSDTLGLTWTLRQQKRTNTYGRVEVWTAVSNASGTTTVTATPPGGASWFSWVLWGCVYRGSDGVGASASANSNTVDLTTTSDNSAIVVGVSGEYGFGARVNLATGSNSTLGSSWDDNLAEGYNGKQYSLLAYTDSGAVGSKNVGVGVGTSNMWGIAAVEVHGAASSGVSGSISAYSSPDSVVVLSGARVSAVEFGADAAAILTTAGGGPAAAQVAAAGWPDAAVLSGSAQSVRAVQMKVAPFFTTDTVVQAGFRLYRQVDAALVADGARNTASVVSIPSVTNGYAAALTSAVMTLNADGSYRGVIVWDTGGATPAYFQDEVYVPAAEQGLDLSQEVPPFNAAGSVGDALNAARAQGFGKWHKVGAQLFLYGADGVTVVRTFTLDDGNSPNQRS